TNQGYMWLSEINNGELATYVIVVCRPPQVQSLIWPGKTALLWAQIEALESHLSRDEMNCITTYNFHQCNYPSIKLDAL
ncbi:hypothetical protein Tco_0983926, partial [Tanacetum coccineum]